MQNLVTILVDPDGKGLVDHWAKTAHAFLTGAILHVLYKCRAEGRIGALPDVAAALSDPSRAIEELYREMRLNRWGTGDTMIQPLPPLAIWRTAHRKSAVRCSPRHVVLVALP